MHEVNKVLPLNNSPHHKRRSMTVIIILITFAYIVLTLPSAIAGGYYLDSLMKTLEGKNILFICDTLSFSYHALNFIALPIANKQFRREFKTFRIFKSKKTTVTHTVQVFY